MVAPLSERGECCVEARGMRAAPPQLTAATQPHSRHSLGAVVTLVAHVCMCVRANALAHPSSPAARAFLSNYLPLSVTHGADTAALTCSACFTICRLLSSGGRLCCRCAASSCSRAVCAACCSCSHRTHAQLNYLQQAGTSGQQIAPLAAAPAATACAHRQIVCSTQALRIQRFTSVATCTCQTCAALQAHTHTHTHTHIACSVRGHRACPAIHQHGRANVRARVLRSTEAHGTPVVRHMMPTAAAAQNAAHDADCCCSLRCSTQSSLLLQPVVQHTVSTAAHSIHCCHLAHVAPSV